MKPFCKYSVRLQGSKSVGGTHGGKDVSSNNVVMVSHVTDNGHNDVIADKESTFSADGQGKKTRN
jgi:hypothetical protein